MPSVSETKLCSPPASKHLPGMDGRGQQIENNVRSLSSYQVLNVKADQKGLMETTNSVDHMNTYKVDRKSPITKRTLIYCSLCVSVPDIQVY